MTFHFENSIIKKENLAGKSDGQGAEETAACKAAGRAAPGKCRLSDEVSDV